MTVPFTASATQLAFAKAVGVREAQKTAGKIAADARARAPVRSGQFRGSISSGSTATGGVVRSSDPAGVYIEFGTVDTPAFLSLHAAARKYGVLRRG